MIKSQKQYESAPSTAKFSEQSDQMFLKSQTNVRQTIFSLKNRVTIQQLKCEDDAIIDKKTICLNRPLPSPVRVQIAAFNILIYQNNQQLKCFNENKRQVELEMPDYDDQFNLNLGNSQNFQYFQEDDDFEKNSKILKVFCESICFKHKLDKANFRFYIFIKYLTIALVYQAIGPFLILFCRILNANLLILMTNLGFWGISRVHLFYIIFWVMSWFILLNIPYAQKEQQFYIGFIIFGIIMKNLVFAGHFAYIHPNKLFFLENQRIILDSSLGVSVVSNISTELIEWMNQSEYIVEEEINQTLKRLDIEHTLFIFSFIFDEKKEYFFLKNQKSKQVGFLKNELKKQFDGKIIVILSLGKLIAKEIIMQFNKNKNFRKIMTIMLALQILRALAIQILEYKFMNYSIILMKDMRNIIFEIFIKLMNFMIESFILNIIILTIYDLERKIYSLTQLSNMISFSNLEKYEQLKILPNVNILYEETMYSWMWLRQIFLDYGLIFQNRENAVVSLFAFSLITISIYILLDMFNIIQPTIRLFPFHLFILTSNFLLFSIFILIIIIEGARINENYQIYKGLIIKNKKTLQLLIISYIFTESGEKFKAENQIHQCLLNNLEQQNFKTNQLKIQHLKKIIELHQNCYQELSYGEMNELYKVLGIAATHRFSMKVLISLITAAISILIRIYLNVQI